MTEAQEQANVFKWTQQPHIRTKWPELSLLFHVSNGGRRDAVEGRRLKPETPAEAAGIYAAYSQHDSYITVDRIAARCDTKI